MQLMKGIKQRRRKPTVSSLWIWTFLKGAEAESAIELIAEREKEERESDRSGEKGCVLVMVEAKTLEAGDSRAEADSISLIFYAWQSN